MNENLQSVAKEQFVGLMQLYRASKHNPETRKQVVAHFAFIGNWDRLYPVYGGRISKEYINS